MSRKYAIETIDNIDYELHQTKADKRAGGNAKKKIGFAPVRAFSGGAAEFKEFVQAATTGESELIIADYKTGNAIRLQAMIRNLVANEAKFTDADRTRMANKLGAEIAKYAGNVAALNAKCREMWQAEQTDNDVEIDEDKIWEELL